ncbi:MAG: protein kinase [Gemmatimonadota bacterium]
MNPPDADLITTAALGELRHELRTPVNHIVGYAEMLLEDVPATEPDRRARLEEALGAARDVLRLINGALTPVEGRAIPAAAVTELYQRLRDPQQRIVRSVTAMMSTPGTILDTQFAQDLERILVAAHRLVPEGKAPAPVAIAGSSGGGVAGQALILVVDDDENNREVLRRRLVRENHAVEVAENGRRALEMIAARSFDLVLLDMLMPDTDGYEVLVQIKEDPATRDIPVIMISALDDMQNIVRCIAHGAEDFLPKPFDPVLLRARISASLEKKRLRDLEKEYLRQVDRVIAAASAVEAGTYEGGALGEVAQRGDALGRLARVFDGMAARVKAREDRLKTQVEDLQREIGVAREASREMAVPVELGGQLVAGQRFAERYEIVRLVGRGGMGAVYRARDRELDEDVAIKTVRRELVSDPEILERFKGEIRLARRISDRNVVRTHDFGESEGVYYLTMEFVEGITVRELIDTRGKVGITSTLAIASQLAHSLVIAHGVGVIHRDIKPQNLLLDGDGVLKVMDFGVARLMEGGANRTEAGLLLGTPAYMPPEQFLGENVDARSDLYAAGVVLYECLTGRLPIEAGSMMQLIARRLQEEPPAPMAVNPEVPAAVSALVMRLMARKPEDRVQSAAELVAELQALG